MAINKEKNVSLQITFPKEEAEQLEVLRKAFDNNGIKVSKSDILRIAFRDYLRILVATGTQQTSQPEEFKEEKKDA